MTAESRPMVVRERVRWADVDLLQIMRFSAYTRLIENAEQELMRAAGFSYATLFDAPKFWMPRRHLAIEYFAPARIDDELGLLTYISRMGDTSATLNVDIMSIDGSKTFAHATMVVVCVTASDFQKRRMPDDLRDQAAQFVMSTETARAWFVAQRNASAVFQVDSAHE